MFALVVIGGLLFCGLLFAGVCLLVAVVYAFGPRVSTWEFPWSKASRLVDEADCSLSRSWDDLSLSERARYATPERRQSRTTV